MRGSVEWEPVKREGFKSFRRFQELLTELPDKHPQWQVTVVAPLGGRGAVYTANYYETEEAKRQGIGYHALELNISVNGYTTSAMIFMKGNEAWEFSKSEEVATRATAHLTDIIEQSHLHAIASLRDQQGRKSYWYSIWQMYPLNHPKITELRSKGVKA